LTVVPSTVASLSSILLWQAIQARSVSTMVPRFALISVVALLTTVAVAQNASPNQKPTEEVGWTSMMSFEGNANSQERVLDLDSTVGYNFDKHWDLDMGVPLSFVSSSTSTTTGSTSSKS